MGQVERGLPVKPAKDTKAEGRHGRIGNHGKIGRSGVGPRNSREIRKAEELPAEDTEMTEKKRLAERSGNPQQDAARRRKNRKNQSGGGESGVGLRFTR